MFVDMTDEVRNLEKIMDFYEGENISRTMSFFIFCNGTESSIDTYKSIGSNVDQMLSENGDLTDELTSAVGPLNDTANYSLTTVANLSLPEVKKVESYNLEFSESKSQSTPETHARARRTIPGTDNDYLWKNISDSSQCVEALELFGGYTKNYT